jgi:hypothetical protein
MNPKQFQLGGTTGFVCKWGLILAVLALGGCSINIGGPTVTGSGVVKSEKRDVKGFDQIDVGGALQLDFAVGKDTSVEVTADDNLLPLIVTEVKGDTLKIYSQGNISTSNGMVVKVVAPSLKELTASGATNSTLTGLNEKTVKLDVSGASKVTASGTTDRLEIDCSGASQVHATKLPAKDVVANVSGASKAEVHADEELRADASGASTVIYDVAVAKKELKTSGASSIIPK